METATPARRNDPLYTPATTGAPLTQPPDGDQSRPHRGRGRRNEWRRDVAAGARDVAVICPGIALLGVTFGLLVVNAGLAWWWTPLFSGLIFGGSLEFLLIVMVTTATPLAAIALSSLLVQGRHLFYGLTFPLHRIRGRLRRVYAVFALTDEAYALTSTRPEAFTSTRILTLQALMNGSWVGGGILGALAGNRLTIHIPALDFVFTALFVTLAVEATLSGRSLADPLLAAACALIARLVAPGQMLLVAMGLYCALLLLLRRYRDPASDDTQEPHSGTSAAGTTRETTHA